LARPAGLLRCDDRRELEAAHVADDAPRGRVHPADDAGRVDDVARDVDRLERGLDVAADGGQAGRRARNRRAAQDRVTCSERSALTPVRPSLAEAARVKAARAAMGSLDRPQGTRARTGPGPPPRLAREKIMPPVRASTSCAPPPGGSRAAAPSRGA